MKRLLFHILFAVVVFDNAFLTQLVKIKYVFEHFCERRSGSGVAADRVQRPQDDDKLPPTPCQPAEEDLSLELHFHFHEPERPLLTTVPEFGFSRSYHLPDSDTLPHPYVEDLLRPPKVA
ncbi:hypothetical protein DCC81_14895 [Chitinophaga parva]|uniref:Uncharacterized protein n=1 Tax=Chitinophaga parva TaxID=2169414 RepID=A0A2T7BH01_9BACT|nr:hypothetical protein [Chitinophaga parva]PUZ25566.1 hypothetical protein DCC81_14895 [Chitinophaga parva]